MAKITVIDDDREISGNIALILESGGHTVSTLNSTAKAAERLVDELPDLLILDVMFPDSPIAGFELAREIRATDKIKNLPILLLTAVNQFYPIGFSADDMDPDWLPVQDFIEKPPNPRILLNRVNKLITQSGAQQ